MLNCIESVRHVDTLKNDPYFLVPQRLFRMAEDNMDIDGAPPPTGSIKDEFEEFAAPCKSHHLYQLTEMNHLFDLLTLYPSRSTHC